MALSLPPAELGAVRIGEIDLTFKKDDTGGTHYFGRGHFEEYLSPVYRLIADALAPAACIDVGANYGYTGLLMRRAFPQCHLTLVEPVPWLAEFIKHNFEVNGAAFDRFHSAIVSDASPTGRSSFGVNERATQDSRVVPQPGATVVETAVVTLDDLAKTVAPEHGCYIKIDTQGWEKQVFAGGEAFLARHRRWFIKTEFAPMWLESQGTDPATLLRWLLDRYGVYESAGRTRWNSATLGHAMGAPLERGCEDAFVRYVRNLSMKDTGWVDLYVVPPEGRRTYTLYPGS